MSFISQGERSIKYLTINIYELLGVKKMRRCTLF